MNRFNKNFGYSAGNGPFISSNIRDLDKELELLQRKRELLQQEQQLMMSGHGHSRKRPYENNQPSQMNSSLNQAFHGSTSRGFSQYYDSGSSQSFGGGSQPPNKRQIPNVWDTDRHFIDQKPTNQRFNSLEGAYQNFNPPKSLMSSRVSKPSIGKRITGSPSQKSRSRSDFAPTKVTKPDTRKNQKPISKAAVRLISQSTSNSAPEKAQILRENVVPSNATVGRLEYALGFILKSIKEEYGLNSISFLNSPYPSNIILRSIKQDIRDRIRIAMLNKPVGHSMDIVDTYRRKFPPKTDKEIVEKAFRTTVGKQKLLKLSVARHLKIKLDEMFSKLKELYGVDNESKIKSIIEDNESFNIQNSTKKDKNMSESETQENDNETPELGNEKIEHEKEANEYEEETKKHEQEPKEDEQETEENEQEVKENEQETKENEQETKEHGNEIKEREIKVTNHGVNKTKSRKVPTASDKARVDLLTYYCNAIAQATIEENLPKLLPNYVDHIIEILDKDQNLIIDIKKNREQSIDSGKSDDTPAQIADVDNDTNIKETPVSETNAPIEAEEDPVVSSPIYGSPYLLKIIGHPNLPNRAATYKFLQQFNAATIKKHKMVPNFLVVTFKNKQDYDNALAANGATIGDITLIIKGNEKKQAEDKPTEKVEDIKKVKEIKTEKNEKPEDDIFTEEIVNQINDLLSSVKKVDEVNNGMENKQSLSENKSDITKDNKSDETVLKNIDETPPKEDLPQTNESNVTESEKLEESKVIDEGLKIISECIETNNEDSEVTPTENASANDAENEAKENEKELTSCEKETGKRTHTRTTRSVATPLTIRTRRASRLAQENFFFRLLFSLT